MKQRRVRFAATSRRHIERERAWWMANRDHQDVFAAELEAAIQILGSGPALR